MSNGTPSPPVGKDEVFDRTARLVMTSVNDADMEAFLLSYPMVLTPRNDLALLWADEYRKACSWRLDGDARKKHQANRILDFMRMWAKTYPNDFTPASRKAVLDVLTKESGGNLALLNEFKLLFLKRKVNLPSSTSAAAAEPSPATPSESAAAASAGNGNGLATRGSSGVRLFRSGSLTARGANAGMSAEAAHCSLTGSTSSGNLTAREYNKSSYRGEDNKADSTSAQQQGSIPASLSGGSLDRMFANRNTGKKQRSATIGAGPLPQLDADVAPPSSRDRPSPRDTTPLMTSSSSFLSSSLSSSHASPPPSPKTTATTTTTTDGRRLNKEQSLSTNNVRSVLSGSPVPAINLHEVRKKDQISLKEKDQKAIKKIRTASLNRQHKPQQQQQQHQTTSLISPRVDKGRLKDMVKELGRRKKFLDFSTASLSRELTMQEWEIFKRIAPREFLNQAWQRENKHVIAPNIIRMINRFNQISYWVATEILTKQDRKTQVKIIKKFIKTAYICFHLGNFNSMMEILSGLNNISISRLKDTWRQVPEKYKAYFEELEAVMDNQQNFARYREQLAKREEAREPTLPYFGLFLRYFTYLDDGNPAYGPDKSINISAMELRLEHVQKVMKYQSIPYNLSRNVHAQNFLNNLHVVEDEDMLYAMSLASQAPSNAQTEQLIAEPDAHMFAEDMIATGRTGPGFSHNRPYLPNDCTDETRDDISEETTSSFLDITTTTTEASTLDREEDGTELSMIESDFEDEEELLEEKVARLRQQILAARAHKEQLAQKVLDLRRQRGFSDAGAANSPDKEKESSSGGDSARGDGGVTRPRSNSAAAEQRSRILREVGHARRVNTLNGGLSPRKEGDKRNEERPAATKETTRARTKAATTADGRRVRRHRPKGRREGVRRAEERDSDDEEDSSSSSGDEQTSNGAKRRLRRSRNRDASSDEAKSEEMDESGGTTPTSSDEGSSNQGESDDSESESESDSESDDSESDDTESEGESSSDDEDEFECESESTSSSTESDDRSRRSKMAASHKAPSSSGGRSAKTIASKPTKLSLSTSPLHKHQHSTSSSAMTPRTSGVYIPPLYFASADVGHSSAANRQRERERERDPYAQYISPRVPNTLPYSPRRPAASGPTSGPSVATSPPSTASAAPARSSSSGSSIRLKERHPSRRQGGSHGHRLQHGERSGREHGNGGGGSEPRDERMEKTSSFRFFAHLSEGVPEVMKKITTTTANPVGDDSGENHEAAAGHHHHHHHHHHHSTAKRTTVPMRAGGSSSSPRDAGQPRRPTSLSRSDLGAPRRGADL